MFEFLGRILEILVAFAMIRSVLMVVLRVFRGMSAPRSGEPPNATTNAGTAAASGAAAGAASSSTLLHQDPVCGTYVAAGSSFRKICNGKVMHFCSESCRDRYVA